MDLIRKAKNLKICIDLEGFVYESRKLNQNTLVALPIINFYLE